MSKDDWKKLIFNANPAKTVISKYLDNQFSGLLIDPLQKIPTPTYPEEKPKLRYKKGFLDIANQHLNESNKVVIAVSHSDGYKSFCKIADPDFDSSPCYCATSVIKFKIEDGHPVPVLIDHVIK